MFLQTNEKLEGLGMSIEVGALQSYLEAGQIFNFAKGLTGHFLGLIGNFFLILIFLMFLLLGQAKSGPLPGVLGEINIKVSRYIWTKFSLSLVTAILVGSVLALIGLDLAFMFAVLVFLLNFIPSVGSVISSLLPLPVALLQFGMSWQFIVIFAVPGLFQFAIGNVLEPKLMGKSLGLHPVTILFFLLFWGAVWGVPGMFLAVPITAILKVVFEQFPGTQPIAKLFAGNPEF